jgi:hypothetical protein
MLTQEVFASRLSERYPLCHAKNGESMAGGVPAISGTTESHSRGKARTQRRTSSPCSQKPNSSFLLEPSEGLPLIRRYRGGKGQSFAHRPQAGKPR